MDIDGESGAPIWAPGYQHLTPDIAPIPFRFRMRPADFVVEEVPLEAPAGEGTHVLFELEKAGLSTIDAVRRLARALQRPEDDFGFAGRKDSFAVTRQWISVEHADPAQVAALEIQDARILRVTQHTKKLRLGQLAGNRFRLKLVDLQDGDRSRFEEVLDVLRGAGIPNYYGAQRFGRYGLTYRLGRFLVQRRHGDYLNEWLRPEQTAPTPAVDELAETIRSGTRSAQRRLTELVPLLPPDLGALARQIARRPGNLPNAVRAIPKRTRRFHLSAFQSRIFNRVLASRLACGLPIDRLVSGDVAIDHATGRTSLVAPDGAPSELLQRGAEAFELSPSGPMPGTRMRVPGGAPGELEQAAILAEGVTPQDFQDLPEAFAQRGARRPLRVPVTELESQWGQSGVELRFRLPKGAFATTLLEELRKDFLAP